MVVYMRMICVSAYHNFKIFCEASLDKFAPNLVRFFRRDFTRLERLNIMVSEDFIRFLFVLLGFHHLLIGFIACASETGSQRVLNSEETVKTLARRFLRVHHIIDTFIQPRPNYMNFQNRHCANLSTCCSNFSCASEI